MYYVHTTIVFTLVLGILIFVHELGHYMMAKLFKVKVEKFSLGFGPRLVGFKRGDTEYCISIIPLGGYVKMAGEEPSEERKGLPFELFSRPKYQQFVIFVAGAGMNIVLAYMFMTLAYMVGINVDGFNSDQPVVGEIVAEGAGAKSGLMVGDVILSIEGEPVKDWWNFAVLTVSNPNQPLDFLVRRGQEELHVTVTPESDEKTGGGDIGVIPPISAKVYSLSKGYPAEKAGIEVGDMIVKVGDKEVASWNEMSEEIANYNKNSGSLEIIVKRDDRLIPFSFVPKKDGDRYYIGISSQVLKKYPLGEAISEGAKEIKRIVKLTFNVIGKLLTFRLPLKIMGGPVQIYNITGHFAQQGIPDVIYLTAILSLQLGIINLMPFPPLDGGLILFLGVEGVIRRDVPIKIREWLQTVGFFLLILLIVWISFYDIQRLGIFSGP